MEAKRQAIIDPTCAARYPNQIAIALNIQPEHRKKVYGEVSNLRNDSYISSKSVVDVPDHAKHVSKTKNLAQVMVIANEFIPQIRGSTPMPK